MAHTRIMTVRDPLDRPGLLGPTMGLLRRALALGLLPDHATTQHPGLDLLRDIARGASAAGVGQDAALALLEDQPDPEQLRRLIERLNDALAGSPLPDRELVQLRRVLEIDDLAALLGVSAVSLRRYLSGARTTPDDIAARIHWLALVVSDLAGAYNEIGIRRWFDRPRAQLGGRSPRATLGVDWDPDAESARLVGALAAALVGPGSAT